MSELPELATEAVQLAVLADRQAGASWAQVGAGLGISADAARHRYGRLRFHWSPTGPPFGMRRSEPLRTPRRARRTG
ncbi:hypothetical protein ABZ297_24150 [Nonomuraea sp. NPDC005983]|uniref:hypothetical protein n=1 Tax=Nonomuraea sp. NPDC005983 TaxID=3155595 RepID=UPI0033AD9384